MGLQYDDGQKLYIVLLILVALLGVDVQESSAQEVRSYVIRLDSTFDLSSYKVASGRLDVARLKNSAQSHRAPKRARFLGRFLARHRATALRKFIRNLPDDLKTLRAPNGATMDARPLQRTFVMRTAEPLNLESIRSKKRPFLSAILANKSIQRNNWPPNDPKYSQQYEFYDDPYNIDLPRAWQYTTGHSGVKVGIIDDAFDYTHPDLGGGIGSGYRFRGGKDYTGVNDSDPAPSDNSQDHGTQVSGIIGAVNNNNEGVVGIAGGSGSVTSGVQLYGFKVASWWCDVASCDNTALDRASVAEAVLEASTDPDLNDGFGFDVDVINLSLGGEADNIVDVPDLYYGTYYDNFVWAWANNVTVVASRGNFSDNSDNSAQFPAYYSNAGIVMSIAGLNSYGSPASGSNFSEGGHTFRPIYHRTNNADKWWL